MRLDFGVILKNSFSEIVRLFVEISPYLILGFLFAGFLHVFLGEKYIKKHLSKSGFLSIIKATLFGIPIPVCSCAVIPLAESLRKDGASKSATMAFLVSTPSSGVDSIFATYALMGPLFAVFRPLADFLAGITTGIVTHFSEKEKRIPLSTSNTISSSNEIQTPKSCANTVSSPPIKRVSLKKSITEALMYGFKEIPGEIFNSLLIGVIIGGFISALVPSDFGSRFLLGSTFLNYFVILSISIPLYICATGSIPIAASLIAKGVLPGAALAFLIAGPATNSVTIAFVFKKMGKKIAALYLLTIASVSVVMGLIFDLLWKSFGNKMLFTSGESEYLPGIVKISMGVFMILILLYSKYDYVLYKLLNRFKRKNSSKRRIIMSNGSSLDNKNGGDAPEREDVFKDEIKMKVPDMNCNHCKQRITAALSEMDVVTAFEVDLENREVTVELKDSTAKKQVLEAIEEMGYTPSLI